MNELNNDVMIYEDKELQETSTCKKFLQVQQGINRECYFIFRTMGKYE